ncbi:MAG TPA: LytR C-terminal domain-containing protein [Patescibacteria group bacterium]|nr:LytR C-terminal domain-containing protein [Patescibacteria group bacterium]
MVDKINKEVPQIDINTPLKVAIEESTDYKMGVTPKNKLLYIFGIVGFIGIGILVSSLLIFYLTVFKGKSENKAVTVNIDSNKIEGTPVPLKTFDRGSVSFEVLNGSGVAGAAKTAGSKVEGLGYKVTKTGNGEPTIGNKLYLRKDIQQFSKEIISDLTDFGVTTVSGELTEGNASARLIIGN